MPQCPCCGDSIAVTHQSAIRQNVLICRKCNNTNKEYDSAWYVDTFKAKKELRVFFEAYNNYIIACNCCDDQEEIIGYRERYNQLKEMRQPKYVVKTSHVDGVSPLAEFPDPNLALAYTMGWLGSNYTRNGTLSWISAYGSAVEIVLI